MYEKNPKSKTQETQGTNFSLSKSYSVDVYKRALERASFLNHENFDNPDTAFNDFINRLDCAVNAIAPFKTVRVKNNTKEWFDGEIGDKHDELHKRFKLTKLYVMKKSIKKRETQSKI